METRGEQSRSGRTRALVAGALVLATVLLGAVARGKGNGGAPMQPLRVNAPVHFAAPAGGSVKFSGTLDRTAVLRGTDGVARMELVIAGEAQPMEQPARVPTDVLVILDRSGSMAGEKLAQARAAIRELMAQLGPQ